MVSGFAFSHLHARCLYVPKVFVFFDPSVNVTSPMTNAGNFIAFGAMAENLSQMNNCKKLEFVMLDNVIHAHCSADIPYALV